MAELYRGKIVGSQGFEKLVAIKRILPHLANQDEFVKAFIDEARLAAHLHHPNIVQIYDFGEMEDSYFISMEYLSGVTLKSVLQKAQESGKALKLPLSLFYIIPLVCEGLEYAHNLRDLSGKPLNIIHRDIGPQNIFITFDGEVKLIDFGIAKASSHDATTYVGSLKGKLAYMSPEQASGENIDRRSDIFSVGILLYELATGQRLYSGETQQILAKASAADFKPAEEIKHGLPTMLYSIIATALAKDRNERYQSAAELQNDLEKCADELSVRLSTRHLAGYMHELFKAESSQEEVALRHAAQVESNGQAVVPEPTLPGGAPEPTVFETKKPPKPVNWKLLLTALLVAAIGAIFLLDVPATIKVRQQLSAIQWPSAWLNKTLDGLARSTSQVEEQVQSKINEITTPPPAPPPPVDRHGESVAYLDSLLQAENQESIGDLEVLDAAVSYLIIEYPEEAMTKLLGLTRLYPQQAICYYHLGRLYWSTDEFDAAKESYSKAINLDPAMDRALYNLGLIQAQHGELERALSLFHKVVELAPDYLDEALFNLALLYHQKGEHSKSLQLLDQAVQHNPGNERARKLLAKLQKNR